jgi:hypothetical protein
MPTDIARSYRARETADDVKAKRERRLRDAARVKAEQESKAWHWHMYKEGTQRGLPPRAKFARDRWRG